MSREGFPDVSEQVNDVVSQAEVIVRADESINEKLLSERYGLGIEEAYQIVTFGSYTGTVAQMLGDERCPVGNMVQEAYEKKGIDGVTEKLGTLSQLDPKFKVEISDETLFRESQKKKVEKPIELIDKPEEKKSKPSLNKDNKKIVDVQLPKVATKARQPYDPDTHSIATEKRSEVEKFNQPITEILSDSNDSNPSLEASLSAQAIIESRIHDIESRTQGELLDEDPTNQLNIDNLAEIDVIVEDTIEPVSINNEDIIVNERPQLSVLNLEEPPDIFELSAELADVISQTDYINIDNLVESSESTAEVDEANIVESQESTPDITGGVMMISKNEHEDTTDNLYDKEINELLAELDPIQAERISIKIGELSKILLQRESVISNSGDETDMSEVINWELEVWLEQLLDVLILDCKDEEIKRYMEILITLKSETSQKDEAVDIEKLNRQGTREYKTVTLSQLLNAMVHGVINKGNSYQILGKYSVIAAAA